jgi:Tol biopolymer transport system component
VRVLAAAILALSVACVDGALAAAPSVQLGFVRGPSIYLASSNGTHQRVILRGKATSCESECTSGEAYYYSPSWSRNGRLAYMFQHYGGFDWLTDVFLIRPGKRPLNVTKCYEHCNNPALSPDGQRLAFIEYTGCCGGDLIVVSIGRPGKKTIAGDIDTPADDPAWAPDGNRIAFVVTQGTDVTVGSPARLYVVGADGRGARRVSTANAHHPSWSPDGRRIAFDNGRHIYVIAVDGSGLRRLTPATAHDVDPAWSPLGDKIAFVRGDRNEAIWVSDVNGRNAHRVVPNADEPTWKLG